MSKNLLRIVACFVSVFGLILLPSFANAQSPTNIRIYVGLGTGTDDNQRQAEDELAKEWNDSNPDIQIKFDYNDYASARDVLLTQNAGGNSPDIVGPVGIGGLNSTGNLWADLTTYIQQDKTELNLDDLEPA